MREMISVAFFCSSEFGDIIERVCVEEKETFFVRGEDRAGRRFEDPWKIEGRNLRRSFGNHKINKILMTL